MVFKIEDKVEIIPQELAFYASMFPETITTGIVSSQKRGVTYIYFNNSKRLRCILSEDLRLVKAKGQQLLFSFMEKK